MTFPLATDAAEDVGAGAADVASTGVAVELLGELATGCWALPPAGAEVWGATTALVAAGTEPPATLPPDGAVLMEAAVRTAPDAVPREGVA